MYKPVLVAAAAVLAFIGADAAFAATSVVQNVTFSVAKSVAITSGGTPATISAINPASGSGTGQTTGTVSVSSNDRSGYQLTASTPSSTVTESGAGCSGTNQADAADLTVGTSAESGGSGGTAGTPGSAVTLSTSSQNLYSAVPTNTGSAMSSTLTYTASPGYTTPANSTNCGYTIPVTIAVVAQ